MKERPILFNGEMVRAILDGRKTQTRRAIRGLKEFSTRDIGGGCTETIWSDDKRTLCVGGGGDTRTHVLRKVCPFGQVGDRLWVRETYAIATGNGQYPVYRADAIEDDSGEREGFWIGDHFYSYEGKKRWFPSIHMPRKVCRILLEITGVRIERIQEISEEDAMAEGAKPYDPTAFFNSANWGLGDMSDFKYRAGFAGLWNSIANEITSWAANPWVWVVEFRRIG